MRAYMVKREPTSQTGLPSQTYAGRTRAPRTASQRPRGGVGEGDMDARKRRYFIVTRDGKSGTLAPLTAMRGYIEALLASDKVREVTFAEYLPLAWQESDYTDPCPVGISEVEYWTQYG